MLRIELWAHKRPLKPINGLGELEYSGDYCAEFFIDGHKVARIDSSRGYHNVDFKSTLGTRIFGVDKIVDQATLQYLLKHDATVLMNQANCRKA